MKELHSAIVETGRMLQDASGSGCDAYEKVLRTHLRHLINIAVGKLEREMEGFTDSPVSYDFPQETAETPTAGENTQSQLPQDNAEAFSAAVDYADGWRPWSGVGAEPIGNVDVRLRNGQILKAEALNIGWGREPNCPIRSNFEVVAWRPA